MDPTLASLALAAGALSILSPCNVGMIPSYFSAGVVSKQNPDGLFTTSLKKNFLMSFSTVAGFISLFGLLGLALALSFRTLISLFPMVSILISAGLLVTGGLMILDIPNPMLRGLFLRTPKDRGILQFYFLGLAYGGVSLSCTLPVFLMVISYAAIAGSTGELVLTIFIYAAGISLVLALLSLLAGSSRSMVLRIRAGLAPHLNTVSGVLVVVTAIYMLMYQLYRLGWMPSS